MNVLSEKEVKSVSGGLTLKEAMEYAGEGLGLIGLGAASVATGGLADAAGLAVAGVGLRAAGAIASAGGSYLLGESAK